MLGFEIQQNAAPNRTLAKEAMPEAQQIGRDDKGCAKTMLPVIVIRLLSRLW